MRIQERGFTLLELLVSVAILMVVLIGIYYLFDQGRWFYLAADRRAIMLGHGRLAMEQMERDFRMIGYGVPQGGETSDATDIWLPAIFNTTADSISFTADIDNGAQIVKYNIGTEGNDKVFVENTSYYAGATGSNPKDHIILVNDSKTWQAATVTSLYSLDTALSLASSVTSPATFPSSSTQVFTLERVCYKCTDCVSSGTYPYGTLSRSAVTIASTADLVCPADTDTSWQTVAKSITGFTLTYWSGTTQLTPGTSDMNACDRITIDLELQERKYQAQQYQKIKLHSDVLLREKKS